MFHQKIKLEAINAKQLKSTVGDKQVEALDNYAADELKGRASNAKMINDVIDQTI
jgi:hypothetical protein